VPKPPTIADLRWQHDLVFEAVSGTQTIIIDGDSREGPSPVQTLAFSVAGCMSVDVAHMLTKGRHALHAFRSHLVADRAQEDPHRFLRVTLHCVVEGDVPPEAVDRAIALSREKYCSVWHSMRQDIEFHVTWMPGAREPL
jgi:putative redox protein